jgi:hypothetical protein
MGREIKCMAELGTWTGAGRLLLETDELIFRGAQRLTVPFAAVRGVRDEDGWLVVEYGTDETARFDLGKLTPSWVTAITSPRTRIDKLGVKPETRVRTVGTLDADFMDELAARTSHVNESDDVVDIVILAVDTPDDLERLAELRNGITQDGAIWVVHPKGDASLGHETLVTAAHDAQLVDNRTARFSTTHTALRFVIPRALRTTEGST